MGGYSPPRPNHQQTYFSLRVIRAPQLMQFLAIKLLKGRASDFDFTLKDYASDHLRMAGSLRHPDARAFAEGITWASYK